MAAWDPEQYLRFKNDRLRPAQELLARVAMDAPHIVVDLGCGPGTSTELLRKRFQNAGISGVDNSPEMIERAREQVMGVDFILADIAQWSPPQKVDLIFSNAVFHWLPDHEQLMYRLAKMLRVGGMLAFQMPDNLNEPSHRAIDELANSAHWGPLLRDQSASRTPVADINRYYDWLVPGFDNIDIWRTSYAHVMPGHAQIVDWMKGAALTPYLGKLDNEQSAAFLAEYLALIENSYPLQEDGSVIFHFPRLFVIARKSG